MATESISTELIIQGIEDSNYEVQTEARLAGVGLKDEQDIASVLEKYAWLYNFETVQQAEEAYRAEADPENKERLRRVYYYLLDGYMERQTAALDDKVISFEMGATVEVDGETISYHNVRALMGHEPDFDRRDRLRDASLGVVEQSNPDRLDILRTRLATLSDNFGYYSYTGYNSEKKQIDYDLLRTRLDDFLARTETTYTELMGGWVEQTTGRTLGGLGSNHFAYVSRLPQYDEYFSKEKLLHTYERTLAGLGLDLERQTNIHLDTEDRPKKNPRAVCYPANPPSEVHLIIKPVGGLEDYQAFFHEAGHAQHYGNEDPSLDYVNRAVGTSYALSEIYSFLVEYLTSNQAWLRDVVGLPNVVAREVAYYTKLKDFFLLRRYVAKLQYELSFFEAPLDDKRNEDVYANTLAAATQFIYSPVNYLNDMDAGFYTADYLRAWITEAMLRRHLETSYGESWFSNPEAGALLRELWATGESKENEDIARMIGYEPFDTTHLADHYLALGQMGV